MYSRNVLILTRECILCCLFFPYLHHAASTMVFEDEMAEDGSNSGDVTKYSILVGFLLIIVFVVPCVAFALLSKYFQKQPLKRKVREIWAVSD